MANDNLKSKIDWFIINKAREMRIERKLTQTHIAVHLGKSIGFVGQVESPKSRSKYNVEHINALSKLFKCSPKDFLPEKSI